MADPKTFQFKLSSDRPPFLPLAERLHPEFHWLTRNRARSRGRDVFEVIDTVVIHATAGFATGHAIDTWKKVKASAHWIIPDEAEAAHGQFAWATVGEAKAAFHVRDNVNASTHLGAGPNVNNRSLGIEIVNSQGIRGRDPYSPWQLEACARIVLYACAKYPNLKHVISHARLDPGRRTDPGAEFPWDRFKDMVLTHSALPPGTIALPPTPSTPRSPPNPQPGNCCEP
ncbi:N-acetylmuramoyl-L-alanine amidase [Lysobacter sp. GCM10012299]|uniref:N-acetylmuramoyl-L-alanine amidase n=1 Tax=Lysobacter sp. GCM10012299 TaxID=3317333 RepID=UPI00361318F8